MRALIALIVIVYLVGVGVALSPTFRASLLQNSLRTRNFLLFSGAVRPTRA